ncbi:MAG: PLP-dependent aminotransferase family protein, partial [Sporomusa sp.]
ETFPVDAIKIIIDEALTKDAVSILQYGSTGGRPELKKAYIEYMAKPKGIDVSEGNLIALTGSNQGIGLIADVLLNPGDTVLVESPTFLTTIMVLKKLSAKAIPVDVDKNGMKMDDLEEKIKKYAPKFIYTIPTFQNPTGLTLPAERREKIAALAEKYGVIIIEDDPYCELRYKGEGLPPIKSFDKKGYVVLLSSFSKIIAPGLRIGVMAAHKDIIAKVTLAKQMDDTHSPNLNQIICAEFLNKGLLPGHIQKIIPIYAERLDAMLSAIKK